jgi:hypothetical protein
MEESILETLNSHLVSFDSEKLKSSLQDWLLLPRDSFDLTVHNITLPEQPKYTIVRLLRQILTRIPVDQMKIESRMKNSIFALASQFVLEKLSVQTRVQYEMLHQNAIVDYKLSPDQKYIATGNSFLTLK